MKLKVFAIIFVLMFSCMASASDVEVWHDPSFRVNEQKKIFIMPPETELNAGKSLAPKRQQNVQINNWILDAVHSGMKRKGTNIIKPLDGLIDDMRFIYENVNPSGEEFFAHAKEKSPCAASIRAQDFAHKLARR